jgi:hypothetical protein
MAHILITGGPWFDNWPNVGFGQEWHDARDACQAQAAE